MNVQEMKNLNKFINEMHYHLSLKYEIILITAIIKKMIIYSCGILYIAVSIEEIMKSLIDSL